MKSSCYDWLLCKKIIGIIGNILACLFFLFCSFHMHSFPIHSNPIHMSVLYAHRRHHRRRKTSDGNGGKRIIAKYCNTTNHSTVFSTLFLYILHSQLTVSCLKIKTKTYTPSKNISQKFNKTNEPGRRGETTRRSYLGKPIFRFIPGYGLTTANKVFYPNIPTDC